VAVAPSDEERRRAALAVDFEDDRLTIGVTEVVALDNEAITNVCLHRASSSHPAPCSIAPRRPGGPGANPSAMMRPSSWCLASSPAPTSPAACRLTAAAPPPQPPPLS